MSGDAPDVFELRIFEDAPTEWRWMLFDYNAEGFQSDRVEGVLTPYVVEVAQSNRQALRDGLLAAVDMCPRGAGGKRVVLSLPQIASAALVFFDDEYGVPQ